MQLHRLLTASALVQGLGLLLTLVLGIQLARYLGPTGYGVYGLVMAVVSIAAVVAQFGLPLLGTREAARPEADIRALVRWLAPRSVGIAVVVSVGLACGLIVVGPQWLDGDPDLIFLAAGLVAIIAVLACAVGILRGAGLNLTGQALDLLVRPVIAVTAVFFLNATLGMSVTSALAAQLATACVCLTVTMWLLRRAKARSADPKKPGELRTWVGTASTYMANGLLGALNGNYPILVASLFVSGAELGIFRVAISSTILLSLPASIANIATIPVVAQQSAAGNRAALAQTLSHTTIAAFGLTALGWFILLILGEPLIGVLFGQEYLPAYGPLLVLGVGQVIIAAFGVSGSYFNLTGREQLVTRAFLLAVPLGIGASFAMVQMFGITGAAIGTVVMAAVWHYYVFAIRHGEVDAPVSLFAAISHTVLRQNRA